MTDSESGRLYDAAMDEWMSVVKTAPRVATVSTLLWFVPTRVLARTVFPRLGLKYMPKTVRAAPRRKPSA
jgi:hypothetical protein